MEHLRLVNNRRPFGLGFWIFSCFTIYQIPSTGVPLYDYQVHVFASVPVPCFLLADGKEWNILSALLGEGGDAI